MGDNAPAAGGSGKWVPDPNPLLAVGGGDSLPLLTVVYFAASLPAPSAVFARSGDSVGLQCNDRCGGLWQGTSQDPIVTL